MILEPSSIDTKRDLWNHFSFRVPGYKFMPSYKYGQFDGYIRLYNQSNGTLYIGLHNKLGEYCSEHEIELINVGFNKPLTVTKSEIKSFIETLNLPFNPRDYQLDGVLEAINQQRVLLLSSTGSGKSLIAYILSKWCGDKILIMVPTISLVLQLSGDFNDYEQDKTFADKNIHQIKAGVDKKTNKKIIISTWQSMAKQPKAYFEQFTLTILDEAHLGQAKSIRGIMEKLDGCSNRVGMTGTLSGMKTHELILIGLFGPIKKITSTKKLIDDKHLAAIKIKNILLKYNDIDRKMIRRATYANEIKFLNAHKGRNRFITKLVISMDTNTLLLFNYIESHGKVLFEQIQSVAKKDQKVFFVHGGVKGEVRDEIRKIVETEKNAIICASSGVFAQGMNLKNLHNVILVAPGKARIRLLQSIGRGLRIIKGKKTSFTLYDIADDLSHKSYKNFGLKHFRERIKIYNQEQFPYKIFEMRLK